MGAGSSQVLVHHLGAACLSAANGRISSTKLEEDEFFGACGDFLSELASEEVWTSLPDRITTLITRHFERQQVITNNSITTWNERPETFINLQKDQDPARQLYRSLEAHSTPVLIDHPRHRVSLVLLHKLKAIFDARFPRTRKDVMTLYLSRQLTDPQRKKVKKNCKNWCTLGRKYTELSGLTGGHGGLFVQTTLNERTILRDPVSELKSKYAKAHEAKDWHETADKIVAHCTDILDRWLQTLQWKPSAEDLGWSQKRPRSASTTERGPTRGQVTVEPVCDSREDNTPIIPTSQECPFNNQSRPPGYDENDACGMRSTEVQERDFTTTWESF